MVQVRLSALKETKLHEYLLRFFFGGLATVLAGLIAKRFGPGIGGLFLAFPVIFPASATLIEGHEKKRKEKVGRDGTNRGRMAASSDAAGAALGCVGLFSFAVVLWRFLPNYQSIFVVSIATAVWLLLASGLWEFRKRRIFGLRMRNIAKV
ncbi:MAG TPA: DUF3147 family protein [Edaphobacter sp.]